MLLEGRLDRGRKTFNEQVNLADIAGSKVGVRLWIESGAA